MPRHLPLLLSLFCLPLSSCLEFDAQEITMRYDEANDRIDFLVVYRGIYYESGSEKADMEKAFKDYDEVIARGQAFVWSNWPLMVDAVRPSAEFAALASHVYVENGGLFTDPTGELNGYQFLRIKEATKFVEKVNTMLEIGVQAALLGGFRGVKFDRDTQEIAREFLRDGEKMFRLERGRLELHLPCTGGDFRRLLGALEDHFLTNAAAEMVLREAITEQRMNAPDSTPAPSGNPEVVFDKERIQRALERSPTFRVAWDNDITIARSEELQVVGLGVPGGKELRFVKAAAGRYSDNFLKAARERGDKVEDGVPDQEIMRRFEDFLTREAALPPELAAIRNN